MPKYFNKFPTWQQIVPVYAVIVLIIYTWTILWFFWKLPSWTFFLNVGEMLTMLAYSLATNFAESLLVLCGSIFLGIVLPRKWFADVFVSRGAALSLAGLGYMIFLADQFRNKDDYPTVYLQIWSVALALALIALIVYLCGRIALIRRILESVADRATIFVYILLPLSIVSVVVVLIRSAG
jgi:hypothetical protein